MAVDPLKKLSPIVPLPPSGKISAAPAGSPKSPANRPDTHESLTPPRTLFQKIWGGIKSVWNFLCCYTFLGRFFKPSEESLSTTELESKRDGRSTERVQRDDPQQAVQGAKLDLLEAPSKQVIEKKPSDDEPSVTALESLDEVDDDGLASHDFSPRISSLNDRNPLIGRVVIWKRTTGKIGADRRYQFGTTLQRWDGKSLQLSPDDLYYPVQVEYRDALGKRTYAYLELPSSLFSQAKIQQDRVGFVYQGKSFILQMDSFFRLTVRKVKPVSFHECEKTLQKCMKFSTIDFLYEDDVPPNYRWWKSTSLPRFYLSPQTQRIQVGEEGTTPLDFSKLKRIPSDLRRTTILAAGTYKKKGMNEQGFVYYFAACGQLEMTILLDQNRLYIHQKDPGERADLKSGKWKIMSGSQRASDNFICLAIPISLKKILRCKVAAKLNNKGELRITIPRVPKGNQLDTCFAHFC